MSLADYDIGAAFQAIEDELIASMIRNMDRHRAWEDDEGIQWSMWQAEQLKALEKYKRANQKKYGRQFENINGQIGEILYKARQTGNMQQEIRILNAIKNGFTGANKVSQGATAEFFRLNDRKLEALIEATTSDMERAETAILRKANDEYRKVIYNAQVYANTGAGTYEKAVDMATKDMLSRGLACVEYANGARHTLADYADMAIRTASKRAYLQGEGEKRQEWGIATVIVNKRGNPCPKCLLFCGKVLIDDVWSGGKKSDGPYPLMSKAIAAGLYHPRCKDSHTTYFPGISTADDTWTKKELEAIGEVNRQEAQKQYAERQTEKYERLEKHSLDADNRKQYKQKANTWQDIVDDNKRKTEALKANPEVKKESKTEKNDEAAGSVQEKDGGIQAGAYPHIYGNAGDVL
ncbi:MAG: phage minor capsid protein [Hungatella hathewayi]|nr:MULTISPECIES: phage minor capsid protein [Hungatella]MCI7382261.1 phage minor capsid protein [Hungatella sp.]MDY6239639.1 phage minor capsid protein [Hungatella hathewayi]